jgi:hypothetical protein
MRPPTPKPGFLGESCAAFVDRSQESAFKLSVAIASEDRDGLAGELEDDHTFQFFALCEPPAPRASMPAWIDVDDVARATLAGLVPVPPTDEDILGTSAWAELTGHDGATGGCVVPINGKDERVPISCEATSTPLSWDTTDVPAGPYWLHGYTYDPPVNEWTPRAGVIVVHDGDPDAVSPWVALTAPSFAATVAPSQRYELRGCAGGAGTENVIIELARTNVDDLADPTVWTAAGQVEAATDGSFAIELDPAALGADAWNRAYVVRARVVDDTGATLAAGHALGTLALRESAETTDAPDLRPPPDWCALGLEDAEDEPTSGGCSVSDRGSPGRNAFLLLALCLGGLVVAAGTLGRGALRSTARRRGSRSRRARAPRRRSRR